MRGWHGSPKNAQHIEFEVLLLGYITYILEANLQSAEFIRRLRRKSQRLPTVTCSNAARGL